MHHFTCLLFLAMLSSAAYGQTWLRYSKVRHTTRPDTVLALYIDSAALHHIPADVYRFEAIEQLDLTGTDVLHLPDSLNRLVRLHTLLIGSRRHSFDAYARHAIETRYADQKLKPEDYTRIYQALRDEFDAWRRTHPAPKLTAARQKHIRTLVIPDIGWDAWPRSLRRFKKLEELTLTNHRLRDIPRFLPRLRSLHTLSLQQNRFAVLHARDARRLRRLQKLNLSENQLTDLPAASADWIALENLILAKNQLAHIPPAIASMRSLKRLVLYQNQLATLPDWLFDLSQLEELDLYYNRLAELSPRIGQMKNLQYLYLSYNQFRQLPQEIGQLSQVRELYCHHNQLSELPQSLSLLQQMEVFHAYQNRLTAFPRQLIAVSSLRDIDLSDNAITEIPLDILRLQQLKYFKMRRAPLLDFLQSPDADTIQQTWDERGVIYHIPELVREER